MSKYRSLVSFQYSDIIKSVTPARIPCCCPTDKSAGSIYKMFHLKSFMVHTSHPQGMNGSS